MTCIVGYIDRENRRVIIGGDSAASGANNYFIRKDPKVFENGDFIIGGTTSFRMLQLLRFSFNPPAVTKDIYEYMCTDFVSSVRQCFADNGFLRKGVAGDEEGGAFLVGYSDRLFKIEDDFQVGENALGFDAVGCGADFALGALSAMRSFDPSPKEMVLRALESAESLSLGVNKPFVICETTCPPIGQ